MAETARPANSLVWTPHWAERFGKRLREAAFNQVSRLGAAGAEAVLPKLCSGHLVFSTLARLRREAQP